MVGEGSQERRGERDQGSLQGSEPGARLLQASSPCPPAPRAHMKIRPSGPVWSSVVIRGHAELIAVTAFRRSCNLSSGGFSRTGRWAV